jgi:hypothetical protein
MGLTDPQSKDGKNLAKQAFHPSFRGNWWSQVGFRRIMASSSSYSLNIASQLTMTRPLPLFFSRLPSSRTGEDVLADSAFP